MGAAFTVSPETIHNFTRPRTTSPSLLQQAALKASRIAYAVETGWVDLTPEERTLLRDLAYELIEPPRGLRGVARKVLGRTVLAWIALRGETDALYEYLGAVRRLVNAVLAAIEREHPAYNQALAGALQAAKGESAPVIASEDIRGWLSGLADQAHREL